MNSIYIVYIFIVIFVCIFIFCAKKVIEKHKKEQIIKKLNSYYVGLTLEHDKHINQDGHITGKAREVIDKIHLLDKNAGKKQNILSDLKYRLIYAYGSNPIKHACLLYLKSSVGMCILPYFLNFSHVLCVLFGCISSIYVTYLMINRAYDKKIAKFLDNFVYAMDIIVRGVKTGLPLNVCFQKIIEDIDISVGEQFLAIIDDFRLGMTVEQAMHRFMQRMPLKEVNFFCLSIIIQGKTGGNLAEIINGLAIILRKRKSMIIKIQTLSSEARSSMKIMMCMPIGVMLLLKFMAPEYINILFDEGKLVLFGCGLWMCIGGLIMRNMVNLVK